MENTFIIMCAFALLTIVIVLLRYVNKEESESKPSINKYQNLHVDFVEIIDTKAVFICHELKKMFYIELDCYDLHHSEMASSYSLQYTPEGWGRHKITHNGKVYKLYEM